MAGGTGEKARASCNDPHFSRLALQTKAASLIACKKRKLMRLWKQVFVSCNFSARSVGLPGGYRITAQAQCFVVVHKTPGPGPEGFGLRRLARRPFFLKHPSIKP